MITGRFRWSSSRSGAGTVRAAVSGVLEAVAFVVGLQDVAAGVWRSNALRSLFSSFRNLTHLASLLLLAEAIKASSGCQILAALLLSQLAIQVESDRFAEERYVVRDGRERCPVFDRMRLVESDRRDA